MFGSCTSRSTAARTFAALTAMRMLSVPPDVMKPARASFGPPPRSPAAISTTSCLHLAQAREGVGVEAVVEREHRRRLGEHRLELGVVGVVHEPERAAGPEVAVVGLHRPQPVDDLVTGMPVGGSAVGSATRRGRDRRRRATIVGSSSGRHTTARRWRGCAMPFSGWSPRSTRRTPGARWSATGSVTRISPGLGRRGDPGCEVDDPPDEVAVAAHGFARVHADAHLGRERARPAGGLDAGAGSPSPRRRRHRASRSGRGNHRPACRPRCRDARPGRLGPWIDGRRGSRATLSSPRVSVRSVLPAMSVNITATH